MASQCYFMSLIPAPSEYDYAKPEPKTKALYYEEKAVGSTSFYKCEACPYMALAEDDIKFHLFTVHLDLAKSNGLADNIRIPCPGCSEVFDAENTLRTHLRAHHKMGIRDVRKMVKSLIQIALRNTKKVPPTKREPTQTQVTTAALPADVQIPQVIEIVPDIIQNNNTVLPSGVTVISVDDLQKMSTPNFEKVDPKEIIEEASINILYSGELPSATSGGNNDGKAHSLRNPTPDLISSVQSTPTPPTHAESGENVSTFIGSRGTDNSAQSCISLNKGYRNKYDANNLHKNISIKQYDSNELNKKNKPSFKCKFENCRVQLVAEEKQTYHISCHHNNRLRCPECKVIYHHIKELHTHLWKVHDIDMELRSCDVCNFKTYSLSRLNNIHKKIHDKKKEHPCPVCGKFFKSKMQMSTHKSTHNRKNSPSCGMCMKEFSGEKELKRHMDAVHEHKKPFQCGECDYSTARKPALEHHLRSHRGEGHHKCNHCDHRFSDHNSLRRHKLTHTKEKKYACKHCPYTSIQSKQFISHMNSKHPDIEADDIFPCPYCKYKTVNRNKFRTHLTTHSGDKEAIHLIASLNSQQKTKWTTPSEEQPKNNWNTPTDNEPVTKWNTPTENAPTKNWNSSTETQSKTTWTTPNETQPKINWNASSESAPMKNWNSSMENQPKTNWTTPIENQAKTNWNTPTESEPKSNWNTPTPIQHCEQTMKPDKIELRTCVQPNIHCAVGNETPSDVNIPIEVDDCDSEQDIINKNYPVKYNYMNTTAAMSGDKAFHIQEILTDLTKDDNNSDCIISESSNDTVTERHQCFVQHNMPNVSYEGNNMRGSNLHGFLATAVTMGDNLLQNSNVNVITSNNSFTSNNMSTSIMSNFPIYLPPNPRLSIRRNLTLTPLDKIPLPVPKVPKAIIKPCQILPVPSSCNSPVGHTINQPTNQATENEGAPRKKPKISVKSNLILKGPDQINMFDSEQNMAFARLQDSERLSLSSPVTFNNLITTCMQLPPEPVLTDNPEDRLNTILPFTPEPMLSDSTIPRVKDNTTPFTFNRQIDLNSMNMMSQEHNKMSIICGNPSYIKLESKQNIQSPSLERMCNAVSMIKTQEIPDEYCKASPLLEEMQKNVNEIKNEIKSDTFFNMALNASQNSPSVMDQHLMDTIIDTNEFYAGHLDLAGVIPPEMSNDEPDEPDIIEIDDNSEDNKLLPPRFDINYPLEYIHSDFYFLESDLSQPCVGGKTPAQEPVNELCSMRMQTEAPLVNQNKEGTANLMENQSNDFENFIHGRKDPMMNTSVRPAVNKINVKNIELMKN